MSPQDPSGINPTDPTERIPTVPAGSGNQPLPPPAKPQQVSAAARQAPKEPDNGSGIAWRVATGVLAVTTIGFATWGFMANKNLNDANAASAAQVKALQEQVGGLSSDEAALKKKDDEKMIAAKQSFDEVKGNLKIDKKDLGSLNEQINSLNSRYTKLQEKASADDATLQQQLRAQQAESALAKGCATVLATGLANVYADVPSGVTFKEVAEQLKAATAKCTNVVTLAE